MKIKFKNIIFCCSKITFPIIFKEKIDLFCLIPDILKINLIIMFPMIYNKLKRKLKLKIFFSVVVNKENVFIKDEKMD